LKEGKRERERVKQTYRETDRQRKRYNPTERDRDKDRKEREIHTYIQREKE